VGGYESVLVEALRLIDDWPVPWAAAGVARADEVVGVRGPADRMVPLKSVTKIVTALTVLVAAEEGTVDLDEPAGPPGATVRHLLAHASGLPFEGGAPIASPGARRIYSNEGFRAVAAHLQQQAGMTFADYAHAAVVEPLRIGLRTEGDPAAGMAATLHDVLALGRELLAPTVVAAETLAEATSVQFPGLDGVVPGIGRRSPNDWGLGLDLHDGKDPYWMGAACSPRAFGHFGGSGTFLWVDPDAGVACAALAEREFDEWALGVWPVFSDAVLAELGA
jgi:CubicO group peptidase (beta-lactamase class C family)